MKSTLVRFGIAMEEDLLSQLDALVEARGVTRSEVLRDLVRAEIVRSEVGRGVPAVAALTLVYDHHVRDLTEKLTEIQHELGEKVRSTLHVHLDHDRCLEVIVMNGRSDELRAIAQRVRDSAVHGRSRKRDSVIHRARGLRARGALALPSRSDTLSAGAMPVPVTTTRTTTDCCDSFPTTFGKTSAECSPRATECLKRCLDRTS